MAKIRALGSKLMCISTWNMTMKTAGSEEPPRRYIAEASASMDWQTPELANLQERIEEEKELVKKIDQLSLRQQAEIANVQVAAAEFARQLSEFSAQKRNALAEVNTYRWALRLVVVVVLGGGFLGILKYSELAGSVQNYLDKRIEARSGKSDRLSLGMLMARSEDYRPALAVFYDYWKDLNSGSTTLDQDARYFFYSNYLWVLGSVETLEPDGTWVGRKQWKELNDDPAFIRFMTEGSWESDPAICNSLGFCSLMHECYGQASGNCLDVARSYFQKAFATSGPVLTRVPNLFAIAMIDLIQNREREAIDEITEAADLDPNDYDIADLSRYENTFKNKPEFSIWSGVYEQQTGGDFSKVYAEFLEKLSRSQRIPKAGSTIRRSARSARKS